VETLILAASGSADPTWFNWAQVSAAVFAATAAVAIPLTAFWRRPLLMLTEREAKRHSHVESDAPYLRLLLENKARRRAARRTRVIVLGYRPQDGSPDDWTSLAHPALGWPSATGETEASEGEVTVYSGSGRPVGLGRFLRARRTADEKLISGPGGWIATYEANDPEGASWHLCLTLHAGLDILNDRDKLPPGEWVIRLLLGADDGDAQQYDVHVAWSADASDGKTVLAETLDRLHVESV
jgi:hypothetical protein